MEAAEAAAAAEKEARKVAEAEAAAAEAAKTEAAAAANESPGDLPATPTATQPARSGQRADGKPSNEVAAKRWRKAIRAVIKMNQKSSNMMGVLKSRAAKGMSIVERIKR